MPHGKRAKKPAQHLLEKITLCALFVISGIMPSFGDTDVLFSGSLVADPCIVDMNSEDQTVEFFPIVARHFSNNEQSYPADFSIWLRGCDLSIGNQVIVTFYGDSDVNKSEYFALSGNVEGLALSITDSQGKAVKPNERQDAIMLTGPDNQLKWQARLRSTLGYGGVTEGEYVSVVTFLLEYE
ncbi:fimbrial protein [Citrobacter farmeri]|uniref:fimbrial protein n=1 Tax=Citrobacter farmeri TaxID=67824 RepID=UPI00292FB341|nr:fimbrial protein [Citrobacter farmeri]